MGLRVSVARRVRWVLRVPTLWCPVRKARSVLLVLRGRRVIRVSVERTALPVPMVLRAVTGWMVSPDLSGLSARWGLRVRTVRLGLLARTVLPDLWDLSDLSALWGLSARPSRGCSSKAPRTRTPPTCRTPA